MVILVLLVFGLIWGSFVNAFVWRLHEGKDWLRGRSECTHCHHKLATADLIPVISWVLLSGKCRYCHKRIDDSPIVEVSVPILFVISYLLWPLQLSGAGLFQFILWLAFIVGFIILTVYDIRWYLLPDKVVFPFTGLAILQVLSLLVFYHSSWHTALSAVVGALIIAGSFYLMFQISKGSWIGGGDVKLGVLLGLLAGGPLQALLLLFVASMSGTIFAIPMLVSGRAKAKTMVPFGPFLLLAMVIVQLFGTSIINWYTHISI
jgi:prepilin signal peptidase PulO-like enzyme (type II secretory pathway)